MNSNTPITPSPSLWHTLAPEQLAVTLVTNLQAGLAQDQISYHLERYGPNTLTTAPETPLWRRLFAQFNQLIIWILVIGAIISAALGEWIEALAILAIVFLNGVLGFFQEERAEGALIALKKHSAPKARVIRDGKAAEVLASDLVPGDLIELEAGDLVPADCRIITAFSLRIDEAPLTGESIASSKNSAKFLAPDTALADRCNMCFLGTTVAAGKATAMVVATGMATEMGKIAELLTQELNEPTPLQRRLNDLGRILLISCLGIVAVIFAVRLLQGGDLAEVLLFSISLAVAAVPEGLPAVVTIALALGLQRMVKRNAIIRNLPSVETLGSVSVICTDKTGTLTKNEMTVREIATATRTFLIHGVGYEPVGDFIDSSTSEIIPPSVDPDLFQALSIGSICNNSHLAPPDSTNQLFRVLGDPTEGAILVAALKAGISRDAESITCEIPFDSERKRMSVLTRSQNGTVAIFTKGATESVLPLCDFEQINGERRPLSQQRVAELQGVAMEMSSRSLRVLAVAFAHTEQSEPKEENLTFVGLIGMMDPPREEVKEAIKKCRSAGIRPVVITGDHPQTALAIARELNIVSNSATVITGAAIAEMSDSELTVALQDTSIFARVSPEHKLRIVKALKERNEIVAMTGDGVNDAPAIKAADIGIAMGITGTDVAKEASDMILTDDNFASIVSAVEEGRGIFENIQKFIHYLLACNASEILLVFVAAALGWPPPLLAIQILWINLVTDGPPALALAMETPEPDVMTRAPRPLAESIFSRGRTVRLVTHGTIIALSGILAFVLYLPTEIQDAAAIAKAQAVSFSVLSYSQLFFAFTCRSHTYTLLHLGLFSNPFLLFNSLFCIGIQTAVILLPWTQDIFLGSRVSLLEDLPMIIGLGIAPAAFVDLYKLVTRHRAT